MALVDGTTEYYQGTSRSGGAFEAATIYAADNHDRLPDPAAILAQNPAPVTGGSGWAGIAFATPVPEPGAWALFLVGIAGLVGWRRRSGAPRAAP